MISYKVLQSIFLDFEDRPGLVGHSLSRHNPSQEILQLDWQLFHHLIDKVQLLTVNLFELQSEKGKLIQILDIVPDQSNEIVIVEVLICSCTGDCVSDCALDGAGVKESQDELKD